MAQRQQTLLQSTFKGWSRAVASQQLERAQNEKQQTIEAEQLAKVRLLVKRMRSTTVQRCFDAWHQHAQEEAHNRAVIMKVR